MLDHTHSPSKKPSFFDLHSSPHFDLDYLKKKKKIEFSLHRFSILEFILEEG